MTQRARARAVEVLVLLTPFVLMAAFGRFGQAAMVGAPAIVPLGAADAPSLVTQDDPARVETRRREAELAKHPSDVRLATDVARRWLGDARSNNEPRALGWALAALAPWDGQADAPSEVLLLRATILQSRHQFAGALADLDRLLTREPDNTQAALTRATVLDVLGRPAEARRDCETLRRARAHPLATAVCNAVIDGLTGHAEAGRERISGVMQFGDVPPSLHAWALGARAELYLRTGDVAAAEADLRASLALAPSDGWTLATLADLLLDTQRPDDARALVADSDVDELLLRHALALLALGQAHPPDEARLRARFLAADQRGETQHLREQARFVLAFDHDAPHALALALANWQHQREVADVRVALEAALAQRTPAAVQPIVDAVRGLGLVDVTIERLIAALGL